MTPEQHYLFDLTGYLHLEKVLEGEELSRTQEAAERYIATPPEELPPGFGFDSERNHFGWYFHAFAFDKALEALVMHPETWPLVRELTNDRPRFVLGNMMVDTHEHEFHHLHSAREGAGPDMPHYICRDGKVYHDFFVIFFYLTDVFPGDGGLIVVPGSHKAEFERPPGLFYGDSLDDNGDRRPDYVSYEVPPGVVNITPRAGDAVLMTESLTHGALNWKPRDRDRRFLTLRYQTQYSAWGSFDPFGEEIKACLSPEMLELIEAAPYRHTKKIVSDGTGD